MYIHSRTHDARYLPVEGDIVDEPIGEREWYKRDELGPVIGVHGTTDKDKIGNQFSKQCMVVDSNIAQCNDSIYSTYW